MFKKSSKIFIAGHKGLVGSAILRKLKKLNYNNIITIDKKKLDLTNQYNTLNFFKKKNQSLFLFVLRKLEEFLQIINIKLILFIIICKYRII